MPQTANRKSRKTHNLVINIAKLKFCIQFVVSLKFKKIPHCKNSRASTKKQIQVSVCKRRLNKTVVPHL